MMETSRGWVADVGGTNVRLALVDQEQGIVGQTRAPTPSRPTPQRILDVLERVMRTITATGCRRPSQMVIGVPGIVDGVHGIVVQNGNLGWNRVAIQALAAD